MVRSILIQSNFGFRLRCRELQRTGFCPSTIAMPRLVEGSGTLGQKIPAGALWQVKQCSEKRLKQWFANCHLASRSWKNVGPLCGHGYWMADMLTVVVGCLSSRP